MRLMLIGSMLFMAACAGTATDTTQPLDRACSVSECFSERDVRDFEVLDPTTLVVYVGGQRCPFQIDLRGTFCDMTFAPSVFFRSASELESPNDRDVFGQTIGAPSSSDLRICSGDLQVGVDGGPFTESAVPAGQPVDRFGNVRSQCQVTEISSLTDDELVELYVSHGVVAPPPPMGPGKIEVGEQEEAEEAAPSETAPPVPTEEAAATSDQSNAEPVL
jgi:hypothetical protein